MSKKRLWAWFAFIAILAFLPLVVKAPFPLHIAIMIFVYTTVGTSWNILSGYAGQISLGQSVFFGFGAYTSSALLVHYGINPWLGLLAGILVTMALGLAIGIPCFRLQGRYFAIATMAVVQIAYLVFTRWEYMGGARGLYLPMKSWGWSAFAFRSKEPYYYIGLAIMLIAIATVYYIERSHIGYYLKTIREDEDAASALGIPVPKYKLIAMMFSTFLAAIAGTFFAQYMLFIDPDSVFMLSTPIMLTSVMGGTGYMLGPLVGASVLIPLQEVARIYWSGSGRAVDQLAYGVLIVIMVMAQPRGILGMIEDVTLLRKARLAPSTKRASDVTVVR